MALVSIDAVTVVPSAVAARLGLCRPTTGGAAALAESEPAQAPRLDFVEFRLEPGDSFCDGPRSTRGGGMPARPGPRPSNAAGAQDPGRARTWRRAVRELWAAGAV